MYAEDFGEQAAAQLDVWARDQARAETDAEAEYDPAHPWHYYHDGDAAAPLPVEEIQPAPNTQLTPPDSLPKNPAKRIEKLQAMLADQREQLERDTLRYQELGERGVVLPLPTRTPITDVLAAYVSHIRTVKTAKSAQTDVYYLRDVFGPTCDAVKVTSRKVSAKTKKRPPKPGQDRRRKAPVIEANSFEQITTADIAGFISGQVKSRGLAPKTANRWREILTRLFN